MEHIGNSEILQIIDAVSREKAIPKAALIEAMEQAYQVAGKKKYGMEHNIKAEIDRNDGDIQLYRVLDVVEKVENTFTQISLEDALTRKSSIEIGDKILDKLPPIDLGRVAAQVAKQVIIQKVSEAERARQYQDYKDRKGDIVSGLVKRIEFGNIFIDLGRAEAILRRDQQIRGESFKINDRVKAYVQDVRKETKGPQIFLSRTDNNFLAKLFELEIPEVYDHVIEIKAVARDPGSKAKVAVFAADVTIDAVGSCIGIKGSRIRAITNELNSEKIDVILWDRNIAQFVINAMSPAEISKIVFNEEQNKVEVVVATDQLSLAIGRRGQNVRLAAEITKWKIDVMTEDQESDRRHEEFTNSTNLLMETLEIDEMIAQLLVSEGCVTVEQVINCDLSPFLTVDGFTKELLDEIKQRAISYVDSKNEVIIEKLETLGVEQELLDILDLPAEYILKLAEFGVKTLDDLTEVTQNELRKIVPQEIMSNESVYNLLKYAKENIKK